MRFDLKLPQIGLIIVIVPVIVGTALFIWLTQLLADADAETQRQVDSKLIVADGSDLSNHLMQAGVCLVLFKATHSHEPLENYDRIVSEIPAIYSDMERLGKSRPQTDENVKKMQAAGNNLLLLMSNTRRPGEPIQYWLHSDETYRHELKEGFDRFLKVFDKLRQDETQFQNLHTDERKREQSKQVLWFFVTLNFFIAWGLSTWFSKRITGRLSVLRENNFRLARRQPLRKPVEGNDEIAELDNGFHQMADLLVNAERQKQEFVQMISHDLRTPLSAIQGTLALALRGSYGNLNEKGQSRIADAEQDSERLIDMISELLDIEKIEAGMLEIDHGQVRLEQVITRSMESVAPIAQSHHVEIIYDGCDATVSGDSDRLIRVVINLLSNAIKYSPPGSFVKITVEQQPSVATVKIIDSGRGIALDKVDKIFDRFAQVEKSDEKRGTGLGLAICKAIIEAHCGRIGVVSQEGSGSTFWFSLNLPEPKRSERSSSTSKDERAPIVG